METEASQPSPTLVPAWLCESLNLPSHWEVIGLGYFWSSVAPILIESFVFE